MILTDAQRERLIEMWRSILEEEKDADLKRLAEGRMRELIAERSPEQVSRMERERGLRAS